MNGRTSSINDPGEENLDRNVLRNEIHEFLAKPGVGIFNRNSGEISSGIDNAWPQLATAGLIAAAENNSIMHVMARSFRACMGLRSAR
jgi:hypothetical protein